MRKNIYLPDDLAQAVRRAMSDPKRPLNVSAVCQRALRAAVKEQASKDSK